MPVARFPWMDFHSVWLHASESAVKGHPAYAAAKAGDPDSAYALVSDLTCAEVRDALKSVFGPHRPVLVSAHAVEREGVNAIPETLADHLAAGLGWEVDSEIVQTNIVGHTGADGFARLARQAEFEGVVVPGRNYLLVDDFVGQGGTLANLRGMVLAAGGKVLGATALTGKPYSARLTPDNDIIEQLRQKHGNELQVWWEQRYGFGYECLTNSEARYLYRSPSIDRIRDRIAASVEG